MSCFATHWVLSCCQSSAAASPPLLSYTRPRARPQCQGWPPLDTSPLLLPVHYCRQYGDVFGSFFFASLEKKRRLCGAGWWQMRCCHSTWWRSVSAA
ncbi:hypothetical protein B0J13DRAFT_539372 [Dactylonectria estremocensis]|uniref:Secreted protein n=1 Tax=Dactylonectria estremocensis TaxID=1079267 RepID=A0A9P9FC53_9HYPO|nr:hypothetical protein B0J13DRAFT_539372 [Dactylonectria estremocensis]